MTPPDSVIVLGQMMNEDEKLAITEHREFLVESEKALRATNDLEIRTLCKYGQILFLAKERIGHGGFMHWIEDSRARWLASESREGFGWSPATVQNYMNLYRWSAMENTTYHEYKSLGAAGMYFMARGVLAGQEAEAVFDTLRKRSLIADSTDDQPNVTRPDTISANGSSPAIYSYPALERLVSDGKLHVAESARIIDAAENSGDSRVIKAVAHFGARDTETVNSLVDIAQSLDKARQSGVVIEDDVFSQLSATGNVHLATGDQIPLSDATPRDLWTDYSKQRKETGASRSADKVVFRDETHRDSIRAVISRLYSDPVDAKQRDHLLTLIDSDPDGQQYQLTVRRVDVL